MFKKLKIKFTELKKIFLFIIFIIAVLNFGLIDILISRFFERSSFSNLERVERITRSIDDFYSNDSYLLGTGFGSFMNRFHRTEPNNDIVYLDYNPHNTILVLLNELGLMGTFLSVFLLILVVLLLYERIPISRFIIFNAFILLLISFETIILSFRYAYPVIILYVFYFNKNLNQQAHEYSIH
jgi:O-antigen ligase